MSTFQAGPKAAWGGPNAGDYDAFVAKYRAVVPEPATGLLLMLGIAALLTGCRTAVPKPNR